MITWTAPLKEHASKLWKEGYNVRQIIEAMQLPVSRNSVISIANRNRELFPKKQPGSHWKSRAKVINVYAEGEAGQPRIWTDERLVEAADLWNSGMFAPELANRMGITLSSMKNAIRRNPDFFKKKEKGWVYSPKLTFSFFSSVPKPPKPVEITRHDNEPESLNVSMVDIEPMACRWPTSGTGADMRFCGHKTTRSYFYCEHHKERRRGKA